MRKARAKAPLPCLEMRAIRKRFGATVALDGVDLQVAPGEILALVGENGAGKSTLMNILSGVVSMDGGTMTLNGIPFAPANPQAARRAGVSMVHQELSLAPHLSVAENVLLGVEPVHYGLVRKNEMHRLAVHALEQLGHGDLNPASRIDTLSLAERQMVEIARAIALGSKVLILDEPTSSLSAEDTTKLFDLLRRLRGRGNAIVYISHVLEEVKEISDRFVVLRDGHSVGAGATRAVTTKSIIALMVGRSVKELYPRSRRARGEVVLDVKDLSGALKPIEASLTLRRGEVLGIAGLLGAGRSELLRSLFGLESVRNGEIVFGAHLGPASPTRRWLQGMGMVSEDRKDEGLALRMSIADNMTLSSLNGLGPAGTVLAKHQERAVSLWIDRLRIKCESPAQPTGSLSGGNQQKVALARLLHHNVDVLLLDEPTRGIDVGSKAEIYRLIDDLAVEGKAILLVSSYLPELLGVCDRVAVMTRGRLHPARPVAKVTEHVAMMEATGLT